MTTPEIPTRPDARPEERWSRRPVLGVVVRSALTVFPIALSVAFAWLLTALTPDPSALIPAAARWVVIAALSSVMLVALERVARRLLPIAALLDLTLAFPDQAPSRFKVALRTGTTGQLARRIAEVRSEAVSDPSISAGQRVIELVAALSVHDRITRGHSERVRAYTQMIADEMGLPEAERERLRWAGLLHDVGKLLVPTSILNKDGRLTDAEFEIIKGHPENGRRIIEELVPWLGESARAVWEHHEKWDGSGYPRGLAGEDISLAARIVAVADVYDVMTSARSYKDPVSPKEARAELARCAGTHFDPTVVRAFLNLSLGRVQRAAGPVSWLAQLSLFPSAVFGSTQAARSAAVLTGALGASSAGVGTELASDTFSVLDPREVVAWVQPSGPEALAMDGGDRLDASDVERIVETVPPSPTNPPAGSRTAARIVPGTTVSNATTTIADDDRPVATPDGSAATTRGQTIVVVTTPPVAEPGSATATPPPMVLVVTTIPPAANNPATAPNASTPTTSVPESAATTTTLPATTTPVVTVPSTTLPTTTLPTTTMPTTTMPTTTMPVVTAPATTTPVVTVPSTTLPTTTTLPVVPSTVPATTAPITVPSIARLADVGQPGDGVGHGNGP